MAAALVHVPVHTVGARVDGVVMTGLEDNEDGAFTHTRKATLRSRVP